MSAGVAAIASPIEILRRCPRRTRSNYGARIIRNAGEPEELQRACVLRSDAFAERAVPSTRRLETPA
jgi:hypothetical protein